MTVGIGFVGRARSGKDTAATHMVDKYGFVRIGFADALKLAALAIDPIIDYVYMGTPSTGMPVFEPIRLSELVSDDGWEDAKDEYPEVRRFLQRLGDEGGRQVHGENTWVWAAMDQYDPHIEAGQKIAIPDVRYDNEVDQLRRDGFLIVKIVRDGTDTAVNHASESLADRVEADAVIYNNGSIAALRAQLDTLWNVG